MDSSMLPGHVVDTDLAPEIEETQGHKNIGDAITSFIAHTLGDSANSQFDAKLTQSSEELVKPLVEGMQLEGSYAIKKPCYQSPLINPDDPTCMKGSNWTPVAQKIMGGDLSGVGIETNDNYHEVYTVTPVHLPEIDTTCSKGDKKCSLSTISVTENYYSRLD